MTGTATAGSPAMVAGGGDTVRRLLSASRHRGIGGGGMRVFWVGKGGEGGGEVGCVEGRVFIGYAGWCIGQGGGL